MKYIYLVFSLVFSFSIYSQNIVLDHDKLVLRSAADLNHALQYDGSFDGPLLTGWSAGVLGTTEGPDRAVLTWKSTGNVEIGGTSSPSNDVRLFIETDAGASSKVGIVSKSNYATPWGYGFISAYPSEQFKAFAAIDLSNNKEVFVVKGNGHVFAQEITVQRTPFPDYVFSKDYSLMPLNELEYYIKRNGHLPRLPSAEEVEVNGVGIGELQSLQMEKIEELILYTIQLNKEIKKLKDEITLLKGQ